MSTLTGPTHKPGPVIHLPGRAPQYDAGALPAMHRQGKASIQPMGYTSEHAAYPVVRHERIREAYATYNGEVVVVEAQVVVKLPGKVRADLVHVRE